MPSTIIEFESWHLIHLSYEEHSVQFSGQLRQLLSMTDSLLSTQVKTKIV